MTQADLFHEAAPYGCDAGATFSPCRRYRYRLWRSWGDREHRCVFVGLNPSMADEQDNDMTITKCAKFARRWGFGALDMVNLFALVSTNPLGLLEPLDVVGPENNGILRATLAEARRVVLAWGSHNARRERAGPGSVMRTHPDVSGAQPWPGRDVGPHEDRPSQTPITFGVRDDGVALGEAMTAPRGCRLRANTRPRSAVFSVTPTRPGEIPAVTLDDPANIVAYERVELRPRERPILFSSEMVRALLAGRKTQTRRVVRPPWKHHTWAWNHGSVDPGGTIFGPGPYLKVPHRHPDDPHEPVADWAVERIFCPYGYPEEGARLWVKETIRGGSESLWRYDADGTIIPAKPEGDGYRIRWRKPCDQRWPSIYMPRWASRITLELTSVRVQRLQDISEEDARAEGVEPHMLPEHWTAYDPETESYPSFGMDPTPHRGGLESIRHHPARQSETATKAFARVWSGLNWKRAPWSHNPWVWALSFRRVETS